MERNNKLDWERISVKAVMIILLIVIIYKQVEILSFFQNNKAQLDADPLVYSANYYNIESCGCILNENVTLHFDKNKSSYLIKSKPSQNIIYNFSIFDK